MKATGRFAILALLLMAALPCWAYKKHIQIDTSECQPQTPNEVQSFTSEKFIDITRGVQAYGQISIRRTTNATDEAKCHVMMQLFVSSHNSKFIKVEEFEKDTEQGEIAGIELIGLSKDGSKFAANYWQAEGDGQTHQPVIYDFHTKKTATAPLEDRIQNHLHHCDQVEDFIGVTNSGDAIFAVPPSTYVDDPRDYSPCGDQGVWYFNVQTGKVIRVKRISGDSADKWD